MQAVLQVLPEGSTLPAVPYLLALALAGLAVGAALWRRRPSVTERVVVAFAPWMVTGSGLYVLSQLDAAPAVVAPFLTSPSVYVSTAIVGGALWVIVASAPADRWALPSTPGYLAAAGVLAAGATVGSVLAVGASSGALAPFWPGVGLAVSLVLADAAWSAVRQGWPTAEAAGKVGALCVFAQTLDGVSTAIGFDVLGFGEQSPVSRAVLEFAAGLPTDGLIGAGWLFVALKLVLGAGVVVLLADYAREEPAEGYLLLAVVAAVGLGPGVHNLLLFTVAG